MNMSLDEIKASIEELTRSERLKLTAWMRDRHHLIWDEQIKNDLAAGRLDALMDEAETEYENGLARPLGS